MISLMSLWLPMLLSAVCVQILSTIAWVFSPHHKSDFAKLPDEDGFLQAVRSQSLSPAQYVFPYAMERADQQNPQVIEKFTQGPVGLLTVFPAGLPNIGPKAGLSFVFYAFVSLAAGYLASRTLAPSAEYLSVFRVTGTVAFMSYVGATFPEAIWFGTPWKRVWKTVGDGLIYSLVTAGVFGWLWPV